MKKLGWIFLICILLGQESPAFSQTTEEIKKILYPRKPFSDYQIIIDRNLFQPRGELAEGIELGKTLPKVSLSNLFLTGIVYDGEKFLAIIEDRLQKSEGFFAEGDSIGEAKVSEINEKEQLVRLEYQGEEIILSLSPLEKPTQAFAPPPELPPVSRAPERPPQPIKTSKSLFPIRERLGIQVREISPELSKRLSLPTDKGLYILVANIDSPAGFANLSGGDILTEINGEPIATIQEAQTAMENISVGAEVSLGVIKKGREKPEKLTVRILKE